MAAFTISYIYEVINKYTTPLAKIKAKTTAFQTQMKGMSATASTFSKRMMGMQSAMAGLAITAGAGAAALFPTKAAMGFEAAMADAKKTINDITPGQFTDLEGTVKRVSVNMNLLTGEVAAMAAAGGRFQVPIDEMEDYLNMVSRTSVAFEIMGGEAGDIIGAMRNKMSLTMDTTGELMDSVNYLADNTAATGANMLNIMSRTAGIMGTIKMPPELVAGWAAFSEQVETTPQLAASGLNMLIEKMLIIPGVSEDLMANPQKAIRDFLLAIKDIEPGEILASTALGTGAGGFALLARDKLELLDNTLNKVSDSSLFLGSMQKELEIKMGTASFKAGQAAKMLKVLSITIGASMLPLVKAVSPMIIKMAEGFSKFAEAHPKLMKFGIIVAGITALVMPLMVGIAGVAALFSFLTAGVAAFLGTAGLVVAVIGGISAAIIAWWDDLKRFAVFMKEFSTFDDALGFWGSYLITAVKTVSKVLITAFKIWWQVSKFVASGIWKSFKGAFTTVVNVVSTSLDAITAFFDPKNGTFAKAFVATFEATKAIIDGTVGYWIDKISSGLDTVKNVFGGVKSFFGFGDEESLNKNVAVDNATSVSASLNGSIDVTSSGEAKVNRAEIVSSMPGNLGMNMAGAH